MAEYFFDSDVLIWCLRGQEESVSFFRQAIQECLPACSSLSVIEIELGMRKGEETQTRSLMDSLQVVSVTKEIARQAAEYIRYYSSKGRQIDFVDAVIAATCAQKRFSLVTYNLKHYPMSDFTKNSP